jgi:hypothetical protein
MKGKTWKGYRNEDIRRIIWPVTGNSNQEEYFYDQAHSER